MILKTPEKSGRGNKRSFGHNNTGARVYRIRKAGDKNWYSAAVQTTLNYLKIGKKQNPNCWGIQD